MYIRKTQTGNSALGETYFTYRLVECRRVGGKVKQITLLNLGRHFPLPSEDWPCLCQRLEELRTGQKALVPVKESVVIERTAHQLMERLIAASAVLDPSPAPAPASAPDKGGQDKDADTGKQSKEKALQGEEEKPDFVEVDVNSLQSSTPRSVGVEHVALSAMNALGFFPLLTDLGINGVMRSTIIASVVARMAAPRSELGTHRWLMNESSLSELLDMDFSTPPTLRRLYEASDVLLSHHEAIENHVFSAARSLLGFEETVSLYDLTNTYFEGDLLGNPKAKRGHSKESRTDCPLLTLGVVCDGSGFIRRSEVFEGNAVEGKTLATMLEGLGALPGATVVMDRGIATEANVAWLMEKGYFYVVMSRERERRFEREGSGALLTASGETIRYSEELSDDGKEIRLFCHSQGRAEKEMAMAKRFCSLFEEGLKKLNAGLKEPKGVKKQDSVQEKIGRLKAKSHGYAQHYTVTLESDEKGVVTSISWKKTPVAGSSLAQPGVYCIRSNHVDWSGNTLWKTYVMLTDLESVFRSLKGDFGLRPIFHRRAERCDGHLFISVLAYQFVHLIRTRLKEKGIDLSWDRLREILSVQRRVTTTFRQRDGRTLHVRKSTIPDPDLLRIYQALGLNSLPGGTRKTFF